jgi:hypothetical protein
LICSEDWLGTIDNFIACRAGFDPRERSFD